MLKIYFDGGCRPNPGAMESAVVARGVLDQRSDLGWGTSEQAEWLALLHALDVAARVAETDILLLGDAIGVINQANGKNNRNADFRARFEDKSRGFDRVRVRYIKRQQNLAGIALGQARQGRRMGHPAKEPVP